MKAIFSMMRWCGFLFAVSIAVAGGRVEAVDSASVKRLFANPPCEYSTAPFWVWNDMLTEEQVRSTLRDLAGQKVRQVFVHPRPGLMTPYLSVEWFRLWKVALGEAKRLDMNLWIYDENSYPSGFAGGLVPEAMPESRGQGLFTELPDNIVGVYRLDGDKYEDVTETTGLSGSGYLVAFTKPSDSSPWYGGKYYVDLLKPTVTEKFLEITMEAYRREIGEEFGKCVPGVFTDEPHLQPGWRGHPWTDDILEVFEKRWGYKLTDQLPSLVRGVGEWKRVRHNYFEVLLELFIERWAKPYYEYCEKQGLEFTGHYWEHEWPSCMKVPDNMAMSAWQQRPGIDTLMNQYGEDTGAQFGNIRAVKELCSVANQLGRRRTLCEAYGAAGWDLRFEDMKRIGDWLYVLGVNTLNEHLSYVTIRGARKRDHPQSFSYHEPWWEAYHVISSYFARLSAILSQGEQVNTILVIEPTTTAWMYQADPNHSEHLSKLGEEFQKMVVALAKAQVEFDIGCEDIIGREGSVEGSMLRIGRRQYSTVVLPPLVENLNSKTMELLEAYLQGSGEVICCGVPPALVDGLPSNRGKAASQNLCWKKAKAEAVSAMLLSQAKDGFAIHRSSDNKGLLFHHRRRLDDGEILFLVNTSIDSDSCGEIESALQGVEQWELESGRISSYPFTTEPNGIKAKFELSPCGSLLLFFCKEAVKAAPADLAKSSTIPAVGPMKIRRMESNVLTLDYVDVTTRGEPRKNIYFYQASKFAFEKNGMDGNPWDNAVQFRDEIITKKFSEDSGFEAIYRFTIEKKLPRPLYVVIERPDLYTISCNGVSVSAAKGEWWLDRSFGKIDIASAAKVGENVITIKASPMTIYHELESAYVLGEFALRAVDSGFVIVAEEPLGLGRWNEQGHPFYAAGVSYSQEFDIPQPKGRYIVSLSDWYGSVAKVVVNGETTGYIYHQPWECDVTKLVRAGANTIEIIVIGTLRNTLGPHHDKVAAGSAWPSMFHHAPESGPPAGDQYSTIGYGLFKPFELHNNVEM